MARAARFLLFSLACLLTVVASPSQAGSPEAPEMADVAGDACLVLDSDAPCIPMSGAPVTADALDVLSSWVDAPAADLVSFHLAVKALAPVASAGVGVTAPTAGCLQAGVELAYAVHFRTRDAAGALLVPADADGNELTDLYVAALGDCDSTARAGGATWDLLLAYTYVDAVGPRIRTEPVNGTIENGTFSWQLPRTHALLGLPEGDAAAGSQVTDLLAESGVGLQGAAVSGVMTADVAPDQGFGLNFTFPAPPPPQPDVEAFEAPATAAGSTTTVTQVQTQTRTSTVSFTETVTSTPLPIHVETQGAPAGGLLVVGLALVVGSLVRRNLA